MSGGEHGPLKLYPDWQVVALDTRETDSKTEAECTPSTRERRPSGGCLRSSSHSPPRSPGEKKQVRFADTMGYDLVDAVHTVLRSDSDKTEASSLLQSRGIIPKQLDNEYRYLAACFPHPGVAPGFLSRVHQQKVCLENAVVPDLNVLGTVRVANIGYEKVVKVRFTVDEWKTFYDIPASYVQNSCDGSTDRFSFGLSLPQNIGVGCRLEFAICYKVNESVYWDNNLGKNYIVVCYAKTNNASDGSNGEKWWHHFV
ncbi:glycogen-binding subunit 76A-like [Ptychodera flava]|uniref:glycogen-binding subunit 76A-like n=1 Tax=Ptychodera flava TaxID=63121 RepID=UPI00396A9A27